MAFFRCPLVGLLIVFTAATRGYRLDVTKTLLNKDATKVGGMASVSRLHGARNRQQHKVETVEIMKQNMSRSKRNLMQLGSASSVGILTQAGILQAEAEAVPAKTLAHAMSIEVEQESWSWTTWIIIGAVQTVVAMAVCWQQFWAVSGAPDAASVLTSTQKHLEPQAPLSFRAAPGHIFTSSNGSPHIQGRKGHYIAASTSQLSRTALFCEGFPLALPAVCIAFLELLNQAVGTFLLLGSGTPSQLAGLGMATMITTCVSVSIGTGLCSAMDTLVSQAHGAGCHLLSCRYLQQCRLLLMVQMIWIAPLRWWSGDLLQLAGQQPAAAAEASTYCRMAILGVALYFQTCCTLFFLKNRGEVLISVLVAIVGAFTYLITGLLYVSTLEHGIVGVGYAMLASSTTACLVSHVYLAFFSEAEGFGPKTLLWIEEKTLSDLQLACPTYLTLALPAVATMSIDVLFWEMNTMVAGLLGPVPLAAHVVTLRVYAFASLLVLGVGSAMATMVGTAVGAKQTEKAMKVARSGLSVGMLTWAVCAQAIAYSRVELAGLYTDWRDVQELVEPLCLFLAFVGFFNAAQGVIAGALRGLGLQAQVAMAQVVCYYIVAMGTGTALAFVFQLGIQGIYAAFGVGAACSLGAMYRMLREVNYENTFEEADRRMQWEKRGMRQPTLADF